MMDQIRRYYSKLGLLCFILCTIAFSSVSVFAAHSTKLDGVSYNRVYDYDYYTTKVHRELRGKSDETVLRYFVNTGMAKGEQAISTFNPKSYRRGSQSLRISYKKNWKKYYLHYQREGYKSKFGRSIATGLTKITKPVTKYDGVDYSRVYDYYYYINRYKFLQSKYPEDDEAVLKQFVTYGVYKQAVASKKFSVKSYRYANQAVRRTFVNDYLGMVKYYIAHPNAFGGATGCSQLKNPITKYKNIDLSKVFDYKYYTTHNSAVADFAPSKFNNDAAAIEQFAKVGIFQGKTAKAGVTKNKAAYQNALKAIRGSFPNYGSSELVKADQYFSNTNYLILVNQSKHMVYIFKGKQGSWNKIKEFPCCVGKPSTPTPTGSFNLKDKGTYFWTGECRCWYWSRITGGILFHSQIYDGSSAPVNLVDGSMGVSCSHGCIRLHISNAKWIYDNMPSGTKIVIYR